MAPLKFACESSAEQQSAHYLVISWIAQYDELWFSDALSSSDEGAAWAAMQAIPLEARHYWFQEHANVFFNCELTLHDLVSGGTSTP